MGGIDRLYVMWSDSDGRRFVIGELWRTVDGEYGFGYRLDLLQEARAQGFHLLPEFPELRGLDAPYLSPILFSTFKQRIPSPSRADYDRMLHSWGAESDDPFEILRRSGGVQMTDRIELAEYRSPNDDLSQPLSFRLAGERFSDASIPLAPETELRLLREPDNPKDPSATLVTTTDGARLGWVPRQYSQLIANLLDTGHTLRALVERELLLPEIRGRWVVRVGFSGAGTNPFYAKGRSSNAGLLIRESSDPEGDPSS